METLLSLDHPEKPERAFRFINAVSLGDIGTLKIVEPPNLDGYSIMVAETTEGQKVHITCNKTLSRELFRFAQRHGFTKSEQLVGCRLEVTVRRCDPLPAYRYAFFKYHIMLPVKE